MIYVNARFLSQKVTGVQRFARELSLRLAEIRDDIVFLVPPNCDIPEVFSLFKIEVVGGAGGHLWEQRDLVTYLKSKGNPLLINFCNTSPVLYSNKIITLHDTIYKHYPKSFSWKFRAFYNLFIPLMIHRRRAFLTVSEFSKKDISKIYDVSPSEITVVYNSVSDVFYKGNQKDSLGNSDKYLLAVSSPNLHKNFHGMISAFSTINYDIKLKIIGSKNNSFNSVDVPTDNRVTYMGRVSDNELSDLYHNAHAFIFPSFYEGFGIPPLEAQACDCPVISSDAASLPEVLGDSALYFDPYDIADMADAMRKVISDDELRDSLKIKGRENIKRFSWDTSAEKVNSVIEGLN